MLHDPAGDGFQALGHSGRYLGARAVFRWLPSQEVGIAVLTNQSRSDPSPILASLLKIALAPPSTCASCAVAR